LLAPHFHEENQFQVFVEGSGSIGPHPIVPVMVHYAGAYTGYGPVMSGPNGLKYFTIRPEFDAGHLPIADARGLNPRGPKVHAQGYVPGGVAIQDKIGHDLALFPPPTAGVHANAIWLPAMATEFFDAPPRNGGGMFYFVVEGSVQSGSTILDRWECVFTDEPIELIAGLHGALLLALGTAARDSQYDGIRICSH